MTRLTNKRGYLQDFFCLGNFCLPIWSMYPGEMDNAGKPTRANAPPVVAIKLALPKPVDQPVHRHQGLRPKQSDAL